MTRWNFKEFKPVLSILIIVFTFLGVAFLQMEERRIGYEILKLNREHKNLIEEKRYKNMKLAKVTRPQYVEQIAQQKFVLKKISNQQVIHLNTFNVSAYSSTEAKN